MINQNLPEINNNFILCTSGIFCKPNYADCSVDIMMSCFVLKTFSRLSNIYKGYIF